MVPRIQPGAVPKSDAPFSQVVLDDFDAMDTAYREFFERNQHPARTTTESPHLFGGSKVEITCMASRSRS